MPVVQVATWVFGLRNRANDMPAPDEDSMKSGTTEDAVSSVPLEFLPETLRPYDPGEFPQVPTEFTTFDGDTDFAVETADASINAPTRISEAVAELMMTGDGMDLVVHLTIEDENGLSQPDLKAAAEQSLSASQTLFASPVLTEIDVTLVDLTEAQIEWRGTYNEALGEQFYYPLTLSIEDEAGFPADFTLQVPILNTELL